MRNNKDNILLTGGSGTLGSEIISSNTFKNLLIPDKEELDLTKAESINNFVENNDFSHVIHCAALARMRLCENDPLSAIKINIIGTGNLVNSIINKQNVTNKTIRFIHISTDGVYESKKGNYSESGATIAYNKYGWSKIGAECSVRMLKNHLIIRTRFFSPENIPYQKSADDIFTSSMLINDLVKSIKFVLNANIYGVINIGDERLSEFDRYKKYKLEIKPCKRNNILKKLNFEIAKDASMNLNKWFKLKKTSNSH